jgi:3-hydroxyisobutyrate dehydrogenase
MGRGMALSLMRAGHDVLGFDASAEILAARAGEGIRIAASVGAIAASVDLIILSLPNGEAVSAVIAGPGGVIEAGRPGLLVIDTTTSDPGTTRRLSALISEAGMAMLDAPVSGGPKGAVTGTMVMEIGGEAADLARAEPILATISRKRVHVGPSGAGHVTKLVNNLLCAAHLLTAGEALAMIRAAGLDPERVLEGVNAGSGRSGVSETNLPTWILSGAFDSGFTMGLMRKDIRLAAGLIASLGLELPLAAATARLWAGSGEFIPDGEDFNRIAILASTANRIGA